MRRARIPQSQEDSMTAQQYASAFASRMIDTGLVAWGSLETWELSPALYTAVLGLEYPGLALDDMAQHA